MRWLVLVTLIILTAALTPSPALAEACTDAPPPRLQVDAGGQVVRSLRGLRLRALPVVGSGEVANLNGGTAFTVIGGPSCNGGYNWWRIELTIGGTRGWLAEGTWTQYFVMPTENLTVCDGLQAPVLYAMLRGVCDWTEKFSQ